MDSSDRRADGLLEPPLASKRSVVIIGSSGGGLAVLAAVVGGIFPSEAAWVIDYLAPARVILCIVAMIVAGSALTLRPGWFGGWLIAAGTCFFAGFGFPLSWDTFRLVAFVFSGLALAGAVLVVLPLGWRMGVASALVLYHFGGIFLAVTSPQPAPFLTGQLWTLLYRPYLQFAYLNNAYQFYSPDPGPASEFWFCIEYESLPTDPVAFEALQHNEKGEAVRDKNGELVYQPLLDDDGDLTGKPIFDADHNLIFKPPLDSTGRALERPIYQLSKKDPNKAEEDEDEDAKESDKKSPKFIKMTTWLKIPRRPQDVKDPLGQSYYRRLSLSENATGSMGIQELPKAAREELVQRRATDKLGIPWSIDELAQNCRVPVPDVQNLILPSYVRLIAHEHQRADRRIAGIKVYRVLHTIVSTDQFVGSVIDGTRRRTQPYDFATYMPYFFGDFDVEGRLRNANDPMLYWLVPIHYRNPLNRSKDFENLPKKLTLKDYRRLYTDYVAIHADSHHMKGELK